MSFEKCYNFYPNNFKFSAVKKNYNALNVFKLKALNVLCFMYKCKQNLNPPLFYNILTHRAKTKYALQNENSVQEPLCQTNFS